MEDYENLVREFRKIKKRDEFPDFLNWCSSNFVYKLPASGWVIGKRNLCVSLSFDELYGEFQKDKGAL